MDLRNTYNLIAEDWHRDHKADDWWIRGAEKFSSLLPQGSYVLDAGCAGGTKARFLIDRGFRVKGVDFSEKFIAIAEKEVPEGEFSVLDLYESELLEESFDGIFLQAVLLHFPKEDAVLVLGKLLRNLRTEGLLNLSMKEQWENQPDQEIKTENDYGYPYERLFSYFTEEELRMILKSLGMEIIDFERKPIGRTRWLQFIAQKRKI